MVNRPEVSNSKRPVRAELGVYDSGPGSGWHDLELGFEDSGGKPLLKECEAASEEE